MTTTTASTATMLHALPRTLCTFEPLGDHGGTPDAHDSTSSPKASGIGSSRDYLASPGSTSTSTRALHMSAQSEGRSSTISPSASVKPSTTTRLFLSSRFPAKYRRMCLLGQGGCGAVWMVQRTSDGEHAAAKIVQLDGRCNKTLALDEPNILGKLDSPFVVRYVDHWTDKKTAVVTVMELVEGIDLGTHMHNMASEVAFHLQQVRRLERGLPETAASPLKSTSAAFEVGEGSPMQLFSDDRLQRLSKKSDAIREHLDVAKKLTFREPEVGLLFVQILVGLHHVHSRGIVHRDIKAGNIFLENTGLLKIGDFGLSGPAAKVDLKYRSTTATSPPFLAKVAVGTPCYMAPELWCTEEMPPYTEKSDMFALGVILFELLAGRRPFPRDQPGAAILAHIKVPLLQYAPGCSKEMVHLVDWLLAPMPADRPTAAQALATPVMQRALEQVATTIKADRSIEANLAERALHALHSL